MGRREPVLMAVPRGDRSTYLMHGLTKRPTASVYTVQFDGGITAFWALGGGRSFAGGLKVAAVYTYLFMK